MVGELCGCPEDWQETNDHKMGGFQDFVEITILFIGYKEEQLMKRKLLRQEQGQVVQKYTFEFKEQAIRMSIILEASRGSEVP
jgi:hypothetical protein